MGEQEPSTTPESQSTDYADLYRQAHPGAIDDLKKAEHVAHATDAEETDVAEHKRKALEHAALVTEPEGGQHMTAIGDHIELARMARDQADFKGKVIADTYDMTRDI